MKCQAYYIYEGKKSFIRNELIFYVCMGYYNIQIILGPTTRIIIRSPAIDQIISIEVIGIYCLVINYNFKRYLKYSHIGKGFYFIFFQVYCCDMDTFNWVMCLTLGIKQNYNLPPSQDVMACIHGHSVVGKRLYRGKSDLTQNVFINLIS